jgi:predicted enzyme related to lactoylglutathione lyase
MDLSKSNIISFIPSTDLEVSAEFYSEKLGLKLMKSDEYALEYELKETILRIAKASEVAKTSYTVLGWEVGDIFSTVEELNKKGVEFIFYEGMSQDVNGICSFPNGGKVAWFNDPDENTLSITQL